MKNKICFNEKYVLMKNKSFIYYTHLIYMVNFASSKMVHTVNFAGVIPHKVLLFDNVVNASTSSYNSSPFVITKNDFKQLFFKKGVFGFGVNTKTILGSKQKLSNWSKTSGPGVLLSTTTYNLVDDLCSLWSTDVSIVKSDWSSSSYINILTSLLEVDDWTSLTFSNTLTLKEIFNIFGQPDLQSGNQLSLTININNANTLAKPVELTLHFTIA